MTEADKRQKIKVGLAIRRHTAERAATRIVLEDSPINCAWEELEDTWQTYYLRLAEADIRWLDSQDVVMKVEKELPDCGKYRYIDLDKGGWAYDKELMRKTCPMCEANFAPYERLVGGE